MKKPNMLKAALRYAEFNWQVFPVAANGKHPLTTNGYKDAISDSDTLRAWWGKWPDANIGLACAPSGVVVLDGDPVHYDESTDAFLGDLHHDFPTAMQVTPTGGVHLVYMIPPDTTLSNSPGSLPPGIDIRANGYILLAPSIVTYRGDEALAKKVPDGHTGQYHWQPSPLDMPPQDLPDIALSLLKPKQERPPSAPPPAREYVNGNGHNGNYGKAALDKELQILYDTRDGNRNNQLNTSAFSLGQLVGGGVLNRQEVIDGLAAAALAIGLDERSTARTILSGLESGEKEPRGVPEAPVLKFSRRGSVEGTESAYEENLLLNTERTDLGNALVANALHGNRLAYTSEMGWLYRNQTHWERDEACAQPTLDAIDTLHRRSKVVMNKMAGQEGIGKALQPVVPSAKHVRDLLYMLRPMITFEQKEFDAEPYLINCRNGVVDLRSGDLVTHDPSDRFTYCVNAEYVADAWMDGMYPSLVAEWFNGNTDHVQYIQRALGYSLTGESREECMFYLVGERGRNGKGTMINGVADILGLPLSQAVAMKAFTNKTADPQGFLLAPLYNSRIVIASEKGRGLALDEELLKTITGRDSIQVAFKGRTPFPFTPKFKLWLMANNPPKGDPSDDAFWSRVRVISMPNSYQGKEDNTIKDRLRSDEERRATLSWLVLGAIQWYRHGLGRADWIQTETQRVRMEQDTILQFADACLENADGENAPFASVYLAYKNWCEAEGIQAKANSPFSRELHLRGYQTDKRSVRVQGEINPKKMFYLLNTRVTT